MAAVTAETAQGPGDTAKASIEKRLQACGYVLLELGDGSFVISKRGHIRPLPDLFAASKFTEGVGL